MADIDSKGGLGRKAARGGIVTIVGQGARIGIQFLSIIVLARLVAPQDFGYVTMVVALAGFGEVFRDFGLSVAAIQSPLLTRGQRDNLLWLNTAIGAVVGVVFYAGSGFLADVYQEEAIEDIAKILSLTFIFNGVTAQYRANLSRDLRMGRLALVDVVGQAAAFLISTGMALAGAGYWAVVALYLGRSVAMALAGVLAGGWLPGLPTRNAAMKPLLKFGWNLLVSQLTVYASKNIDAVMIGRNWGPTAVGFYNRAFEFLILPLTQINAPASRVAIPVLSSLQSNNRRFWEFLLFGQKILVHAVVFFFSLAFLIADNVVTIALGPGWEPVVPLFRVLCIAGVFEAVHYASYWIFVSQGLTSTLLRYTLTSRPVLILMVVAAAQGGVMEVAAAYSLWSAMAWPYALWCLSRSIELPVRTMIANCLRPLLVYPSAAAAGLWARDILGDSQVTGVFVGITSMVGLTLLVTVVWSTLRQDIKEIIGVRRMVLGRLG